MLILQRSFMGRTKMPANPPPTPVLPYVPDGSVLAVEANSTGRLSYIQTQPFLVEEQPRPIDVLHLNLRSLVNLAEIQVLSQVLAWTLTASLQ